MRPTTEQGHSIYTLGVRPGIPVEEAVEKMRARIAGTSHQLERIVRADRYELKRHLTRDQATHYLEFLRSCGLNAEMEAEPQLLEVDLPATPPPLYPVASPPPLPSQSDFLLRRRLTDYEKISGALWVALGIVQCLTVVAVIAGIWNIFAGWSRFKTAKRIFAGDRTVPHDYESFWGLVVIGLINLLLGGAIGVIFVGFDFFIRDKILSNTHLFEADIKDAAEVRTIPREISRAAQ